MNGLILHCGSRSVSREALALIETPEPTHTWRPVAHALVADLTVDEARRRGLNIVSDEYGLGSGGKKMFGVLRLAPEGRADYARALGIRNSHDKSLALGLTVGLSVMVCDNLAFGGEKTIHRKHSSGLEIEGLLSGLFDKLEAGFARLERNVNRIKLEAISIDEARRLTVIAAEMRAIPSCDILSVLQEYKAPKHAEFQERTEWSLLNAFTETAKKYSPMRANICQRKLASLFRLDE